MPSRLSYISIFKKIALCLVAFAFGSVCSVALIESGMRAIGYGAVQMLAYGRSHYNPDLPELGYAGRPNVHGIQANEGVSQVVFNSHGFNDIEHSTVPSPRTFRVAVIGNSYSMAVQVERKDGFVWQLGPELSRCQQLVGRTIETINLAVNGYTIHQQYLMLRDYGLSFSPDLVLLQANSTMDIDPLDNLSPRIEARDSGKVFVDYAYLETPRFQVRASRLAALVQELSDHSRVLQYALEYRRRANFASADGGAPTDTGALDRYRQGRDLVFGELVKLLHARGIPLVATVLPNADASSYLAPQDDPFRGDWKALAGRYDVPFLDLETEARAQVLKTGKYLHGFGATVGGGHLNRFGHAFMARALGDRL